MVFYILKRKCIKLNVHTSSLLPSTYKMTTPIYRFKLSTTFQESLSRFACVHCYDEPSDFKHAWDIWCGCHKELFEQEKKRLSSLGYKGDIIKKTFRSARYYFKDKTLEKKKPQERKPYVPVPARLIEAMDVHIKGVAMPENLRPAYAYNNFISKGEHMLLLGEVEIVLEDTGLDEAATDAKIKKTYKNRYYLQQRRSRSDKGKTL